MPALKTQSNLVDSRWKSQTDAAHKFTMLASVAVGDTIIVAFTAWNFGASTGGTLPVSALTDQLGNTYTILTQLETGGSSHHFLVIALCRVTVAGTPIITPTLAIANNYNSIKGRAYCWSTFYASPVDQSATVQGGSGASSVTTPAKTLNKSAPFMAFSAFCGGQVGGTFGLPAGYTLLDNAPVIGSGTDGEQDFAAGYLDVTTASNAGASVTWTNSATSTNGTVAATHYLTLGCRVRGRLSSAGVNATALTVEVWPSGDPTTSLATRYTGKTADSSGYVFVAADPAWSKAVGTTVAMDVTGTDAITSTTRSAAGRGAGTIEIGIA